jgi:hypothetical protein
MKKTSKMLNYYVNAKFAPKIDHRKTVFLPPKNGIIYILWHKNILLT